MAKAELVNRLQELEDKRTAIIEAIEGPLDCDVQRRVGVLVGFLLGLTIATGLLKGFDVAMIVLFPGSAICLAINALFIEGPAKKEKRRKLGQSSELLQIATEIDALKREIDNA